MSWPHLIRSARQTMNRPCLLPADAALAHPGTKAVPVLERPSVVSYPEVSCSESSGGPIFDLSLKEFLEYYEDVSVRLNNGIRFAASEERLPYRTLGDYLNAGPERIEQMLKLPALGRKSVYEFDELAARAATDFGFDGIRTRYAHGNPQEHAFDVSPIFDIPLDEFLAQQPAVSVRLRGAIHAALGSGECPFASVAEYLRAGGRRLNALRKLPNLGASSVQEFETLVQAAIRNGTIAPPSQLKLTADGFPELEDLMQAVLDALDERQVKLLLDRVESEATLEATAQHFGITRERVRQIEKKAIGSLVAKFGQAFLEALAAIDTQCRQRGLREITLSAFSELSESDVMTCGLYFRFLKKFGIDDAEPLVLRDRTHLYRPAAFLPSESWDRRIDQALIETRWPIVFKDFVAEVDDVPRFHVEQRLRDRYHATIVNDAFAEPPRMSVQKMCLQVLASTRMPMHLTEIRAGVFKHFDVDLNLHHVNRTVGYHDAITIYAPGTYVRYVDLGYPDELINTVCLRMYEELEARQVFLNSKVLFERLFAADLAAYPAGFNHYLLLGFAQDDPRFVAKRGNMIGLAGFDIEKTYISLEDEVRNIVLEHGPIDVGDIVAQMADTRKLCNDTGVRIILANSPEVIQVGRRTYDSLHRFFANREEYDALVLALKIALLAGTKSDYALAEEMATLDLRKASIEVIRSILSAADDITQANGMYRFSAQDPQLLRYQEIALACLAEGGIERLRREADAAFGSDVAAQFIRFDRRFEARPAQPSGDTAGSELHAILADFEF